MSSKPKDKDTVYEAERKAVIIGETFTRLLTPLANDLPALLIPICGIPLLEYMINSLSSSNVKEIIICVKNNSSVLLNYIEKKHSQKKNRKNYTIKVITSEEFNSVGDCLRKINNEKILTSDFILIRGLVITNVDLDAAFNIHLENKKKDKNCLMTSLFKNYKNDKNIRTPYDENIIVYNSQSKKILQYEGTNEKNKVQINENVVIKPHKEGRIFSYEVRSDLYDGQIDICSLEVLNLFTENFDYQYIRDDFYKNILVSEIYTDTFYLHEVTKDLYVGLIRNPESYLKVSFEILNRWAYPIVIEDLAISPKLKINYKSISFSIYNDKNNKEENFSKAKLLSSVVLSKDSIISDFSELSSCIIGEKVIIGKNCQLINCIILNDTVIEDNVHIENSIIASECCISAKVIIKDSIIGDGVLLNHNAIDERIYLSQDDNNDNEDDEGDSNEKEKENDENSDLIPLETMDKDTFYKNLEDREVLFLPCPDTTNDEDENEEDDDENVSEANSEEEEDYKGDIEAVINNSVPKDVPKADIIKEISGLKNAFWEKTYAETLKACMVPIFSLFMKGENFNSNHIDSMKDLLISWKGLFNRMIATEEVQIHFISVLEDICIEITEISEAFHIIIQLLNSEDLYIISDEAIRKWVLEPESTYPTNEGDIIIPDSNHKNFAEKMKKYIESNIDS